MLCIYCFQSDPVPAEIRAVQAVPRVCCQGDQRPSGLLGGLPQDHEDLRCKFDTVVVSILCVSGNCMKDVLRFSLVGPPCLSVKCVIACHDKSSESHIMAY